MKSNIAQDRGYTLIELVTTIAVAGMVSALAFTLYTSATGAFKDRVDSATVLNRSIILKKQIEQACNRFSTIKSLTHNKIDGFEKGTNEPLVLRFFNGTLFFIGDTVTVGLERFDVSLVGAGEEEAILLWEGVATDGGGWMGGATAVKGTGGQ